MMAVSQPVADKLDNSKADIEKEGPANTSRGNVVVTVGVIMYRQSTAFIFSGQLARCFLATSLVANGPIFSPPLVKKYH